MNMNMCQTLDKLYDLRDTLDRIMPRVGHDARAVVGTNMSLIYIDLEDAISDLEDAVESEGEHEH